MQLGLRVPGLAAAPGEAASGCPALTSASRGYDACARARWTGHGRGRGRGSGDHRVANQGRESLWGCLVGCSGGLSRRSGALGGAGQAPEERPRCPLSPQGPIGFQGPLGIPGAPGKAVRVRLGWGGPALPQAPASPPSSLLGCSGPPGTKLSHGHTWAGSCGHTWAGSCGHTWGEFTSLPVLCGRVVPFLFLDMM